MLRKIEKVVPILATDTTENFERGKINKLRKNLAASKGSGITLTRMR